MHAKEIIQLMQQNRQPTIDLLPELELLTAEYPWFSIAYQLRLKVLKAFDEELFSNQLPLTAAHTINRGQLYSYLFIDKPLAISEEDVDPIFYYQPDEVDIPTHNGNENLPSNDNDAVSNTTNLETTPIDYFALEEEKEEEASTKDLVSKNDALLEKFISANPKIVPRQQEEQGTEGIKLADSTEGIASESLALIYIQQKFYDKALAVYKELSLQNPEKRAYFAALIKKVKEEIK